MAGRDRGPDETASDGDSGGATPELDRQYRRLSILVVVALVPWTFVLARGTPTFVLSFGLFNIEPTRLTTITDYYFRFTGGLPRFLLAWGLGALLYLLAVGSAVVGLVWQEDTRLTAALLALAGLTELWVSLGFLRRPGYLALPIGTVCMWIVVWLYYRPDLRAIVVGRDVDRE